jgi:hypothetical protein
LIDQAGTWSCHAGEGAEGVPDGVDRRSRPEGGCVMLFDKDRVIAESAEDGG